MKQKIIVDTNVYGDIHYYFQQICSSTTNNVNSNKTIANFLTDKNNLTYEDIWDLFSKKGSDLVKEGVIKKKDWSFIEIFLDQQEQFEILVPEFVYAEYIDGKSSKKFTKSSTNTYQHVLGNRKFLESIPCTKDIVPTDTSIENVSDLSKISDEKKMGIMRDFLVEQNNSNLQNLLRHINDNLEDVSNKNIYNLITILAKKIQKDTFIDENIATSPYKKIYDAITQDTYKPKIIESNKIIEDLAKRLIKSKEEFDFFDLMIYLEAKEKKATIITGNDSAFYEIYDPTFRGYFNDIPIFNPNINFKSKDDVLESGYNFIEKLEDNFDDELNSSLDKMEKRLSSLKLDKEIIYNIKEYVVNYFNNNDNFTRIFNPKRIPANLSNIPILSILTNDGTLKIDGLKLLEILTKNENPLLFLKQIDDTFFKSELAVKNISLNSNSTKNDKINLHANPFKQLNNLIDRSKKDTTDLKLNKSDITLLKKELTEIRSTIHHNINSDHSISSIPSNSSLANDKKRANRNHGI